MSSSQSAASYPDLPSSTGPTPYSAAAPPGYPTMDASSTNPQNHVETKSKGDGFWKGCCAALCCCWVLDACCF
ncbi:Cysteine-rich/transmembrane domain A-like protein [Quillaja saponaria]|uniref:Cysteine-rich/transmembrane domain A-like protein n=1 Tax=Quillaja saponaria TaxID=32244 RepID=A0AAD7LLI1_QUISA|nr:Cysteine-rich/transmembrane domain A-like protein [Quillaja saponaria]